MVRKKQPENTLSGCFHIHKILLGQPLFAERDDNIALFQRLVQHIQKQPETEFHIYHLVSTAAINVHTFPHTMIHALHPNDVRFEQANFVRLYDLMHKMGIAIHPIL